MAASRLPRVARGGERLRTEVSAFAIVIQIKIKRRIHEIGALQQIPPACGEDPLLAEDSQRIRLRDPA